MNMLKKEMFFFEKKNQKTFAPLSRGCGYPEAKSHAGALIKFFCFFLFTKRSAFL